MFRNAIRESLVLIDFSSAQSNTTRAIILEAVRSPQFIAHTHSKRLLPLYVVPLFVH